MRYKLELVQIEDLKLYKKDMQAAFQYGYEKDYGKSEDLILPEKDIDNSLNQQTAVAYKVVLNNEIVGGAILQINNDNHNHLDFLYVKNGFQGKKIGQFIWNEVEKLYPNTEVWETCTPYFEKRNIHFYVNCLKFHIVEYYNEFHKDPNEEELNEFEDKSDDSMFRFEKVMK